MPRRDGMGPTGTGPMTGRGGKGICFGLEMPGNADTIGIKCGNRRRLGLGKKYGTNCLPRWARCRNQSANDTLTGDEEKELLKNQAILLENQLCDVKNRLAILRENTEE